MKASTTFFIIVFIGALLGSFTFLYFAKNADESANLPTPIEAKFVDKIVYTTDASFSEEPFKEHCTLEGGTFNSCGNPCAPDAEVCVAACAYTCEF